MNKHRKVKFTLYITAWAFAVRWFIFYALNKKKYYQFLSDFLHEKQFSGRIRSYVLKMNVFVIPFFESLSGKKLNQKQKNNLLLAAVITPLFDDAIEKNTLGDYLKIVENRQSLFNNYETQLFSKTYLALYHGLENPEDFMKRLYRLIDAEKMSPIPYLNLVKGGMGLSLYAQCANLSFSQPELDFIEKTGIFFQLVDDIYDFRKDKHKGIITLPVFYYPDFFAINKVLKFRLIRLLLHQVNDMLGTKQKKAVEGMLFLLFCLSYFKLLVLKAINKQKVDNHSSID